MGGVLREVIVLSPTLGAMKRRQGWGARLGTPRPGAPHRSYFDVGSVTLFICNVTAVCENNLPSMDA